MLIGLFRVFLGIEAGTATLLHDLGRGQITVDNERALEVVNRLGLHVRVRAEYPDEGQSSME
jgi:hypothetical protein